MSITVMHKIFTMFHVFMFCALSFVLCSAVTDRCKITDRSCMLKVTNSVYKEFFKGENNGVDPMHNDEIGGTLGDFHYKFTDIIVKGFKDCVIIDASVDVENLHFEDVFSCPLLSMEGNYDIGGKLFNMPIEGTGNFTVAAYNYRIKHHMLVGLEGTETETQMQIKKFTFDAEVLDSVTFTFDNLFNGNKELREQASKLINENWKSVTKEVQDPFLQVWLSKIVTAANRNFKQSYLQKYFIL